MVAFMGFTSSSENSRYQAVAGGGAAGSAGAGWGAGGGVGRGWLSGCGTGAGGLRLTGGMNMLPCGLRKGWLAGGGAGALFAGVAAGAASGEGATGGSPSGSSTTRRPPGMAGIADRRGAQAKLLVKNLAFRSARSKRC